MASLLISGFFGRTLCLNVTDSIQVGQIKTNIWELEGIPVVEQRLTLQGKQLWKDDHTFSIQQLITLPPLQFSLGLLGGKGGFGALLRGAGAKAGSKKVGNEDCRDLNGRRIRHVKNEQRLAEWYQQQKEREANGGVLPEKPKERKKKDENKELKNFGGPKNNLFDRTERFRKSKKKKLQREEEVRKKEEDDEKTEQEMRYTEQLKAINDSITLSVEQGTKEIVKAPKKDNRGSKHIRGMWQDYEDDEGSDEEEIDQKEEIKEENQMEIEEPAKRQKVEIQTNDSIPPQNNGLHAILEPTLELTPIITPTEPQSNSKEIETTIETTPTNSFDLNQISTIEELESLGLEKLKTELQNLGLLCGGTLKQRAERLFSVKGKNATEIEPKFFAKPNKRKHY